MIRNLSVWMDSSKDGPSAVEELESWTSQIVSGILLWPLWAFSKLGSNFRTVSIACRASVNLSRPFSEIPFVFPGK
jgi:hypothetical protein